jgi:hypothetical protein
MREMATGTDLGDLSGVPLARIEVSEHLFQFGVNGDIVFRRWIGGPKR